MCRETPPLIFALEHLYNWCLSQYVDAVQVFAYFVMLLENEMTFGFHAAGSQSWKIYV